MYFEELLFLNIEFFFFVDIFCESGRCKDWNVKNNL